MQEGKILTYANVAMIPAGENRELLVDVRTYNDAIVAEYEKFDMAPYTGERIFVRDSVAKKLAAVQAMFSERSEKLKVVYGYRYPEIQKKYFDKRRAALLAENPALSLDELDSLTHQFVAVPSVAGHPTGAAIDVTFINAEGEDTDMGTRIADFSDPEKIKTFAEGISESQKENRRRLHDLMKGEGFAPFYGEWWHFSYGDREWAALYGKAAALYSPLEFRA